MKILVLSCSLSPASRSRVLARESEAYLRSLGVEVAFIDARDHPMPMCDGEDCDPQMLAPLRRPIEEADAILMAVPIYNYDVNAAAKNIVELTGSAWEGKIVGFLCTAGGQSSYMSIMSLASSLMLDFRCVIVPRFVYATGGDFGGEQVASEKIAERLRTLCDELVRFAQGLIRS